MCMYIKQKCIEPDRMACKSVIAGVCSYHGVFAVLSKSGIFTSKQIIICGCTFRCVHVLYITQKCKEPDRSSRISISAMSVQVKVVLRLSEASICKYVEINYFMFVHVLVYTCVIH